MPATVEILNLKMYLRDFRKINLQIRTAAISAIVDVGKKARTQFERDIAENSGFKKNSISRNLTKLLIPRTSNFRDNASASFAVGVGTHKSVEYLKRVRATKNKGVVSPKHKFPKGFQVNGKYGRYFATREGTGRSGLKTIRIDLRPYVEKAARRLENASFIGTEFEKRFISKLERSVFREYR